jgi:hypothetical protein
MWIWCIENFGHEAASKYFVNKDDRWKFEDYLSNDGFYAIFKDVDDATLFKLVWI